MKVTDEMVNIADSILSRSRPGIPDDTIRMAITAAISHSQEKEKEDDLPFRHDDIMRGLILFRTSNNAHGYTNFVSLTAKVDALPQAAKDELATMMRNFADGLSIQKEKCAICEGEHDNDLLADICTSCETRIHEEGSP